MPKVGGRAANLKIQWHRETAVGSRLYRPTPRVLFQDSRSVHPLTDMHFDKRLNVWRFKGDFDERYVFDENGQVALMSREEQLNRAAKIDKTRATALATAGFSGLGRSARNAVTRNVMRLKAQVQGVAGVTAPMAPSPYVILKPVSVTRAGRKEPVEDDDIRVTSAVRASWSPSFTADGVFEWVLTSRMPALLELEVSVSSLAH